MATRGHEHEETRERLLRAAEQLFAAHGFEATSVRDITADAGCNVAAVNYHFGGKDRLYVETFRNLLPEIRDRRIEIVEHAMRTSHTPTLEVFLEALAEAFWDPFVNQSRGRLLMGFFMHEMLDPKLPREVFADEFARPLMDMAETMLQRIEPTLEPLDARMCVMSVVGQLLHAFKARQLFLHRGDSSPLPSDLTAHIRHIVRFSAAGVRAFARSAAADRDTHRELSS